MVENVSESALIKFHTAACSRCCRQSIDNNIIPNIFGEGSEWDDRDTLADFSRNKAYQSIFVYKAH